MEYLLKHFLFFQILFNIFSSYIGSGFYKGQITNRNGGNKNILFYSQNFRLHSSDFLGGIKLSEFLYIPGISLMQCMTISKTIRVTTSVKWDKQLPN